MPIPSRVLAAGNSPLSTTNICGDTGTALVAVGTTQATALQLSSVFNALTTSSASTGVKLPPCEAGALILVYNLTGQTQQVYTNETSGVTMNSAVAGSTGVQVGNTKTGIFFADSATHWCCSVALTAT